MGSSYGSGVDVAIVGLDKRELADWLREHGREHIFADTDNADLVIFYDDLAEALLKFIKGTQ